ncbi:MAG TPA: hypothetical protein VFZ58_04240 [Candidatus Saccharimonadales bacterium]
MMQQSFGVFEGLGVQEAVIILFFLVVLAFVLVVLFDLLAKKKASWLYKLIWTLVIVLIPLVGALLFSRLIKANMKNPRAISNAKKTAHECLLFSD